MGSATRIEGGSVSCRFCNRTLTFNMTERPAGECSCAAAKAHRAEMAQPPELPQEYPHFHDAIAALVDEHRIPSVDVCGWCSDSECDGLSHFADLDPDDDRDSEAIEELHELLRQGKAWRAMQAFIEAGQTALAAWMMADEALADANNRTGATDCEQCGREFPSQGPCAEPEPYVQQRKPSPLARIVVFTLLRRSRCQAHWWCSWPATEQGGTCDPHDPHLAAYIDGST